MEAPEPETPAVEAAPQEPHPWATLAPERFQLLRLMPLPVDRRVGPRPLRFVQLGQVERHGVDESLLRLTVQIPGQLLHREVNVLEVWVDHRLGEIRLGPERGLQIEPEERGLGRFLLARAAAWAKPRWGHYGVHDLPLARRDALDEESRTRRDHVLTSQGFVVEAAEDDERQSLCRAARVSQLREDWNTDKVQLLSLLDGATLLEQCDRVIDERDASLRQLEDRIALYRRDDVSLRFAIGCLAVFCLFQAALLIWMALR
ncbi:hypothetical protein [Pseudomonas sp. EpS/L25]|uniref:hypothetical protein n=1 Tax=Pseudomonas sp. EpS/L25 TaxID=1749078 RepID=UPI00074391B4|nr:hypothetical protein [Pseudomonas sp. EpS/L25]KUM44536.1 hypothetical protein AR540_22615 [Pseudomonas sp. EpS/L25]